MDGGSTDQTLEILRKYETGLRFISEKDRGQSDAINKGLQLVTGDVISYLNSDDVLEPGALIRVGEFFASHPDAFWLAGRCRMIDPQGREIRKTITLYKNFWLYTRSYQVLRVLDFISQPATFWRRQVIDRIGKFDESLHYAMDYDYSLRVGEYYKLWTVPETLASFRVHPASKSTLSVGVHFDEEFQVLKRHTTSPAYLHLHAIHNQLITNIYKLLFAIDK
jgi:glycosyltransferase involved in cell wall biosynthesis